VADISDRLTISNQSRPRNLGVSLGDANDELVRSARLPNDLYLVGGGASCNLNISWPHGSVNADSDTEEVTGEESYLPARTSLAFSDQDGRVSSAIANFFLVYTNQTSNTGSGSPTNTFRAAEVLLHFCVNTYEASTSRGLSTSRVVHSSTLAAEDASGNSIVNVRHVSSSPRRVFLRSANTDGVYSVKREDVKFLNNYILSLFSGVYSHWYGKAIGGETATSEALGLAMFQREPSDDDGMRSVVESLTANVATSLTNTQVDFLRLTAPLTLFLLPCHDFFLISQLPFCPPSHPPLCWGRCNDSIFHVVGGLLSIMSALEGRRTIGRYHVETGAMLT
jgi:hypothetical protein